MSAPRLVMFDMDGTLIDTGAMIAEHLAQTFSAHGFEPPTVEMAHSIIGLTLDVAIMRLAQCDAETALMLADSYKERYRATLAKGGDHEPLYDGALDALTRLQAQASTLLGVATGKGLPGVNRILAAHNLADHFITLQTPDHNPSKPHPGMLLRAMAETGMDAARTVMIGDTTFDMELGNSAGAKTIGVTWGYHARVALEEAGAHIIVTDYADLDAAIEKVLS